MTGNRGLREEGKEERGIKRGGIEGRLQEVLYWPGPKGSEWCQGWTK